MVCRECYNKKAREKYKKNKSKARYKERNKWRNKVENLNKSYLKQLAARYIRIHPSRVSEKDIKEAKKRVIKRRKVAGKKKGNFNSSWIKKNS